MVFVAPESAMTLTAGGAARSGYGFIGAATQGTAQQGNSKRAGPG